MKKFGIVINETKDPGMEITNRISSYLSSHGASCVALKDSKELKEEVECMLVLGGDGTMLQAAGGIAGKEISLIGVNLGTLGYLAEMETENLEEALDRLLQDEYEVEERIMLQGSIQGKNAVRELSPALNDITITRCGSLQIISLKISVNGQFLCRWNADGIIISTPTGSTGYNMSAGGPIVEPGAKLIVLTPICAHTLNARSIILKADDFVEIEIDSGHNGSILQVAANSDGNEQVSMETGDKICISKAKNTTKIIKLSKVSFLEILHKKMGDYK
ncbi:MAG: NAD(+)/NADH kinase [Lachnospiraceae bacterium]|nr:NAD(+)/NADH kinase [Lachnospiraceae bacterium]